MDELNHLGWVANGSFRLGRYLVGVRTNSGAFAEWLNQVLGAYGSSEETKPYFSVWVAGDELSRGRRAAKEFHILYEGGIPLIRSLDITEVAKALLAELESFLYDQRQDALYARAALVSARGINALVPEVLVGYLARLGRSVARAGLTLPRGRTVAIDTTTGTLQPLSALLTEPDWDFERIPGIDTVPEGAPRAVVAQPLNVDVVLSTGLEEPALQAQSTALATYRLGSQALNLRLLGHDGIEGFRRLISGARCCQIRTVTPAQTLEAVLGALGGV